MRNQVARHDFNRAATHKDKKNDYVRLDEKDLIQDELLDFYIEDYEGEDYDS